MKIKQFPRPRFCLTVHCPAALWHHPCSSSVTLILCTLLCLTRKTVHSFIFRQREKRQIPPLSSHSYLYFLSYRWTDKKARSFKEKPKIVFIDDYFYLVFCLFIIRDLLSIYQNCYFLTISQHSDKVAISFIC